ncbi:MAG: DUF484 family protein [Gammaproteobacteria bacterium]|nr:DUF484 family protein [Gammaproteobacteria bacterium]
MSNTGSKTEQTDQNEESTTIEFLRKNPDVLMSYPDVFGSMTIPHQSGGVTSLVERQMKMLREENYVLKKNMDELVGIARENEDLNLRFHRLALELIGTDQLDDVLAMVQNQVQTFFYTDFVSFRFLPSILDRKNRLKSHYLSRESGILETVEPWVLSRKPVCGHLDNKINRELFGDNVNVGSSALIPLFHTNDLGLLCLGSSSETRFKKSMGTIFLQQLGELVSIRVQGLLGL